MEETEKKMNLNIYGYGEINLLNERIIIPIYFHNKLDFEGMKEAFNKCLDELKENEKEVLKQFN